MKNNRLLIILVSLLLIAGVLYICGLPLVIFYNLDAPSIHVGEIKAAPILTALEDFNQDRGKYPDALGQLIPQYLIELPVPGWRYTYCYSVPWDNHAFTLAFIPKGEVTGDGWNVYDSSSGTWERTDSDFYYPCNINRW